MKLTVSSIQTLFPKAIKRHYHKGQIVCYDGDRPQHIFFIASGHIRYYDIDKEGNEKILHIIGKDNVFPMLYAFRVTDYVSGFYATLDETEILAVPLNEFQQATKTNVELSNALTKWFLGEINQLVFRVSSLQKTDARDKVLHVLAYLATEHGKRTGDWQQLGMPITQQFVADLAGLARETVSTIMHSLEKEKLIRTHKPHSLDIRAKVVDELSP